MQSSQKYMKYSNVIIIHYSYQSPSLLTFPPRTNKSKFNLQFICLRPVMRLVNEIPVALVFMFETFSTLYTTINLLTKCDRICMHVYLIVCIRLKWLCLSSCVLNICLQSLHMIKSTSSESFSLSLSKYSFKSFMYFSTASKLILRSSFVLYDAAC